MHKIYTKNFKIYFIALFALMVSQTLLATEKEFLTGQPAATKFWQAREYHSVQLFSVYKCTEPQAKSEMKRLFDLALKEGGVNLSVYPAFATKVMSEDHGYGAIGIFYTSQEAQALCNKLSFLPTNPIVRKPTTSNSLATPLNFVIYRDPK